MITGLACIEVVAKLNQINIDVCSIEKELALSGEITLPEMVRVAKSIGFRAKIKNIDIERIVEYPLPCIAQNGSGGYFLVLKIDRKSNKMLTFDPDIGKTNEMTFDEFLQYFSGSFIVMTHKNNTANIKFGFNWFFQEFKKYKRSVAEVLLGSFVIQLFGLITPLFTQVILDKVVVHQSMSTLDVLAIAFIAVALFELLLGFARQYIFLHTANKVDARLGSKLFRHLFSLPYAYFESRQVGNIIARVRELDQIREFISSKSISVVIDLFFSFIFAIMMFFYSTKLAFIVIAITVTVSVLSFAITPELRKRLESKFQMAAQSNSYLVESVTGIQTVKSLAIEGSMQKKWEERLGEYLSANFHLGNLSNVVSVVSGFLQKVMTISILYFGVYAVLENTLTIGQLIAFQMFANQFISPVLRLVGLWHELQQALLGVERLSDILNHPTDMQNDKAVTLHKLAGNIKFDNVSFRYSQQSRMVLDSFCLDIAAGMSIGVVGRSGSGKSTLAKLLQRLYLPYDGAIYVDGLDIRHLNPFWLRHNIGTVLQENYLFSGSIKDNISIVKQSATMEEIISASKIAGADEFISQMPEGYDTLVGERGSSLSGGQRQRIAIARALMVNPRILIFDEATSALDYESEKIILSNLKAIKRGRTTIIIAHRLSNVKECDIIVAMDKGKIIEIGSHTALLAKKGYYYGLAASQGGNNVS